MKAKRILYNVLHTELAIAKVRRADLINALVFSTLILSIFPLTVGPYQDLLVKIGVGVIWIATLFTNFLTINNILNTDKEDGSLSQWLASGNSITVYLFAKLLAHWWLTGVPLALLSPVWSLFYGLELITSLKLLLTILIGSLAFSALAIFVSSLTVYINTPSFLLAILLIPLYVPIMVLSCMYVQSPIAVESAHLALLLACTIFFVYFSPRISALALKLLYN